jgi:hypothetical protein
MAHSNNIFPVIIIGQPATGLALDELNVSVWHRTRFITKITHNLKNMQVPGLIEFLSRGNRTESSSKPESQF